MLGFSVPSTQLARCGPRDGVRRMTFEELVGELLDHDRTHWLELDKLGDQLKESEARPKTGP
jgi:hypothetical protein